MSNLSGFAAELKAVSNKLDALIAKIDSTMTAIAAHSPQQGVGPVVGMALTNTLERVPFSAMRMHSSLSRASTLEPTTPAIR